LQIPRFQLARDVRLPKTRPVLGRVDFILFEGWRVGVHHPNFFEMNAEIDTLVYMRSDFKAVLNFKREKINRDRERLKKEGRECEDLYEIVERQYGLNVDDIFDKHYFAVADRYIVPVMRHADVVLVKSPSHHLETVDWQHGHWLTERGRQSVDDVDVVTIGWNDLELGNVKRRSLDTSGAFEVTELTRAWNGKWVLQLVDGSWVRAALVICGPLAAPADWAARMAAPRRGGCPWDGLPSDVHALASGKARKLGELETGVVLLLGLASDGRARIADRCESAGHQVYVEDIAA